MAAHSRSLCSAQLIWEYDYFPLGNLAHWAMMWHSCPVPEKRVPEKRVADQGMTEPGLREAKRRETAHALAQAAFDLAQEHGVDGFTIDEVAARAGYSRRTFANHYAGKEEAIVAVAAERVRRALDVTPHDDLPPLEWLHAVAKKQLSGGLISMLRELRALAEAHPPLRPHLLEVQRLIRETALEALMGRFTFVGGRAYAHLLVGAAYGALNVVLEGQIPVRTTSHATSPSQEEDGMTMDDFLDLTFTQLRDGF